MRIRIKNLRLLEGEGNTLLYAQLESLINPTFYNRCGRREGTSDGSGDFSSVNL